MVLEAESSGKGKLGDYGIRAVGEATGVIIGSLLESNGASASALIIRSRDADVVTATLVGQTGMVASKWPLPVDVQCSQLHFIVQQSFGVVAIGKINTDNLFILRIQVVQTPGKRRDVISENLKEI